MGQYLRACLVLQICKFSSQHLLRWLKTPTTPAPRNVMLLLASMSVNNTYTPTRTRTHESSEGKLAPPP